MDIIKTISVVEWLIFVQTIILFATGIVIYWYTKETKKMRIETSKTNQLISEQINQTKLEFIESKKLEEERFDPKFEWENISGDLKEKKYTFTNRGAQINNIGWRMVCYDYVTREFYPKHTLGTNKQGYIRIFTGEYELLRRLEFLLFYTDLRGYQKEITFSIDTSYGYPEEKRTNLTS